MAKKKQDVECYSCGEEFIITYNPRSGVFSFCPFCGDEIDISERPALMTSFDDLDDDEFEDDDEDY